MELLLNPNIAYMILLAGVVIAFFSASTPGTGVGEITALFCFVLAGYAAYKLSIHWWALVILISSIVPFILAVRNPSRLYYLGITILLLVIGSVFLFASEDSFISVNPILAILSSGVVAVLLWYMLRNFVELSLRRPMHDTDALIGQSGTARTLIKDEGTVYINGEIWSARSESAIPLGSNVRVVRREGFVLVVENE
jgi:membrane-bound serine protease (ClpP class)